MQQHVTLRNAQLKWELPSTNTCNMCFKTGHQASTCKSKLHRSIQYKQLNKLYQNRGISIRKPIISIPTPTKKKTYKQALIPD